MFITKQKGRKDKASGSKKEGSAFDFRCFHIFFSASWKRISTIRKLNEVTSYLFLNRTNDIILYALKNNPFSINTTIISFTLFYIL